MRFEETAERGRHGAGDFFKTRVHVLGGVDDLSIADGIVTQHAVKTGAPGLQIGDPDDVVIAHRDGDIFGGCGGQRERLGGAAVARSTS